MLDFRRTDFRRQIRQSAAAERFTVNSYTSIQVDESDFQTTVNVVFRFFNDWYPVFCGTVFLLLDCRLFAFRLHFIVLLCIFGNRIGMGKTQWESRGYWWEQDLTLGMERNGNWLHVNGRESECDFLKSIPGHLYCRFEFWNECDSLRLVKVDVK